MAVILDEKNGKNLIIGASVVGGVLLVGAISYYLFLKSVPGI
jgi:hypothetical protein